MPLNRVPDFSSYLMDLLETNRSLNRVQPIYLGGSSGTTGGSGAPPGGFIGKLAQQYVAYDTSEAETLSTGSKSSLLDNLNHIRWRITNMSSGSSSGSASLSNATPQPIGTANAGVSGLASRGDHVHAHGNQTAGTSYHILSTQASAGFIRPVTASSGSYLDSTGNWSIPTGTGSGTSTATLSSVPALALGATALAGTSGSASRYDHVHTHGALSDGTLHSLASQTGAGFLRTVTSTSGSVLDSTGNWSVPALASQTGNGYIRKTASTSGSFLNSTGNWSVPAGGGASSGSTYLLPFTYYNSLPPWDTGNFTAFTSTVFEDATIIHWRQSFLVADTNDASNYWDIELCRLDSGGVLATMNTIGGSPNDWFRIDAGTLSVPIIGGMVSVVLQAISSGTPGQLWLHGPAVQVQV
jgi:hypothetical protein